MRLRDFLPPYPRHPVRQLPPQEGLREEGGLLVRWLVLVPSRKVHRQFYPPSSYSLNPCPSSPPSKSMLHSLVPTL